MEQAFGDVPREIIAVTDLASAKAAIRLISARFLFGFSITAFSRLTRSFNSRSSLRLSLNSSRHTPRLLAQAAMGQRGVGSSTIFNTVFCRGAGG